MQEGYISKKLKLCTVCRREGCLLYIEKVKVNISLKVRPFPKSVHFTLVNFVYIISVNFVYIILLRFTLHVTACHSFAGRVSL